MLGNNIKDLLKGKILISWLLARDANAMDWRWIHGDWLSRAFREGRRLLGV
jgi:hypothetical protein